MVEQLGVWRIALLVGLFVSLPFVLWLLVKQLRIENASFQFEVLYTLLGAQRAMQTKAIESAHALRREIDKERTAARAEIKQIVRESEREQSRMQKAVREMQRTGRIPIPQSMRLRVFLRDSFRCCECGYQAEDGRKDMLHVDHIVPVSLGGTNEIDNLQTLCTKCNLSKSAKLPNKFKSAA